MARTATGGDELTASEEIMVQNLNAGTYENVTPSGTKNGSNTVFTLPAAPSPNSSLKFWWNGQLLKDGGDDFILSGATITMNIAPISSDILLASFLRNA